MQVWILVIVLLIVIVYFYCNNTAFSQCFTHLRQYTLLTISSYSCVAITLHSVQFLTHSRRKILLTLSSYSRVTTMPHSFLFFFTHSWIHNWFCSYIYIYIYIYIFAVFTRYNIAIFHSRCTHDVTNMYNIYIYIYIYIYSNSTTSAKPWEGTQITTWKAKT
jgi:hypothetical protein